MQLFALTEEGKTVFAEGADKKSCYFCPECGASLKMRSGPFRKAHFFHLQTTKNCRSAGKSATHLQVQIYIQEQLPPGQGILERRFSEINRIADVAWEEKRIIFEVQCSPISREEVIARQQDYARVGFQLVWILHDNRYNSWRVTPAEEALFHAPIYFTNITKEGSGIIYDQYSIVYGAIRKKYSTHFPIRVGSPSPLLQRCVTNYPLVEERQSTWPLFFEGDLISQAREGTLHVEIPKVEVRTTTFWERVKRGYQIILRIFLERTA